MALLTFSFVSPFLSIPVLFLPQSRTPNMVHQRKKEQRSGNRRLDMGNTLQVLLH